LPKNKGPNIFTPLPTEATHLVEKKELPLILPLPTFSSKEGTSLHVGHTPSLLNIQALLDQLPNVVMQKNLQACAMATRKYGNPHVPYYRHNLWSSN